MRFAVRAAAPGRILSYAFWVAAAGIFASCGVAQQKPLPEPKQLMREASEHQKQMDKIRENYTYTAVTTTEDVDAKGRVKKSETEEREVFFVNRHEIGRVVKKNGRTLDGREAEKETERVTKLVEKAERTPREQTLDAQTIPLGKLLEIMDTTNERRETYRGRAVIVFDFQGNKGAKTHGLAEDLSKKLKGTLWVDEQDREVAHADVSFYEDFRIGGGLVGKIAKGSRFSFDQAQVNGEIWLPTGAEGTVEARLLLVKGMRQHFVEKDWGYKRFRVETEQPKDAKVAGRK